jgi:hypothetical protein
MITNLDQTIARFIQLIPTDLLPKGKIYQGNHSFSTKRQPKLGSMDSQGE